MTDFEFVPVVPVQDLHKRLGIDEILRLSPSSLGKPLTEWKMDLDDAPILRYLYRNWQPKRHLEFGTWRGLGVCYCLEECEATVWTINLLEGEHNADGSWAYGERFENRESLPRWANKQSFTSEQGEEIVYYQTDALGFIGSAYLQKGLGHRVCQIYCDSQQWDSSNYPANFFDTVLVDGGHTREIVLSDTRKGVRLLRSGGLMLWHDFCPRVQVRDQCSSTQGVMDAIRENWGWLGSEMRDLFWIDPSWLLVGIKK